MVILFLLFLEMSQIFDQYKVLKRQPVTQKLIEVIEIANSNKRTQLKEMSQIEFKGKEGKEHNPLRGYATDNANFKDKYSQYWDLSRWMSKMNMADFRGGHKASNIVGNRST
jgi:hypothetical protein